MSIMRERKRIKKPSPGKVWIGWDDVRQRIAEAVLAYDRRTTDRLAEDYERWVGPCEIVTEMENDEDEGPDWLEIDQAEAPVESVLMAELTDEQIERHDAVDNAIHALLQDLAGAKIDWDTSLIGRVRDVISEEFSKRGIMTEMEFYPYLDDNQTAQAHGRSSN
jgi:hypothetical protein